MEVSVKTYRRTVSYDRDPEPYGDWHEELDSGIDSVTLRSKSTRHDWDLEEEVFDILDGSTQCHVVAVFYSDGDSFGRCDGKMEVVWAFGDAARARECLRAYRKAIDEDTYSVVFLDDHGNEVKQSNVCFDYFAHDTSLDVHTYGLQGA